MVVYEYLGEKPTFRYKSTSIFVAIIFNGYIYGRDYSDIFTRASI